MYSFQSYVYHTLLIDGITYLCATDNALDMGAPSAFLREVSDFSYNCKNLSALADMRLLVSHSLGTVSQTQSSHSPLFICRASYDLQRLLNFTSQPSPAHICSLTPSKVCKDHPLRCITAFPYISFFLITK